MKCRGREYLRIIYGPDYTTEENLARLRSRGLGRKRSLALGEFALGIEGLERFVRARAAAAGPRVRLRRAGPGERAGGPEAMISACVDFTRPPTPSSVKSKLKLAPAYPSAWQNRRSGHPGHSD